MTRRFEPRIQTLQRALAEGIRASEAVDVRQELGLPTDADDRDVARSLVQILAACQIARVELPDVETAGVQVDGLASIAEHGAGGDASFLGRLNAGRPTEPNAIAVDQLDNIRTLVAVLRGGSLDQRRAAVNRIGTTLAAGGLSGEETRAAHAVLSDARDVELAYELAEVRRRLSGSAGRDARAEYEAWRKQLSAVELDIHAYWEAERATDPIAALPGDQRVQLLTRLRDLPDVFIAHIAAALERAGDSGEQEAQRALLSSIRYAGDRRLAPTLIMLLESDSAALVAESARALRRIDDPRCAPALARLYERSVFDIPRALVAGALGAFGDRRGKDYVRGLLDAGAANVVRSALEALETLGGAEEISVVVGFLDHTDDRVVAQAVRTLARIGDRRALERLGQLRSRTHVSALRAEIEDSYSAIAARIELRGEEVDDTMLILRQPGQGEAIARPAPAGQRVRGWFDFVVGHLWLTIGGLRRAIARFESAAGRRTRWSAPLVAIAMALSRRERYAQALGAFRRAIEADRDWVEKNPIVIRALARCFLRRAEQVERDGRLDVARGLMGEVLTLDLRRAPAPLRFELERRYEVLRRTAA